MGSPRLRGFFGASSNGPARKSQPPASKSDSEADGLQQNVTPPTTPSLSSPEFPLSQTEYELKLQLPITESQNQLQSHAAGKRAQLPPLPRRTTASPVRLPPSIGRLNIGAGARSPPPASHSISKPTAAPAVVVEEWGSKSPDSSTAAVHQRPLPSVPGSSPPSQPSNAAGSSRHASSSNSSSPPIAGPSRHPNAIAGSSKHVNAVATSSKHPAAVPAASPSSTTPTATIPPSSKVLMKQQPSPRTHKQNSPSFSMRYQPLVADPSPSSSAESVAAVTSSTSSPSNPGASSSVRPLPRIPPSSAAPVTAPTAPSAGVKPSNNSLLAAPTASRYIPTPAKVKRPKTSPSVITGFSPSTGSSSTPSRSAFENIPSSWASRPVDLNAQRPSSPPAVAHSRPLPLKSPRARSHSRPRRDRSLDSYHSRPSSSAPRVAGPNSARATTTSFSRHLRSLPSPTITGGRPLPKRSTTTENGLSRSKTLNINVQTSIVSPTASTPLNSASNNILSPTGRRLPPSPPTGPVPRIKTPVTTPIATVPPRSLPPRAPSVPRPSIPRTSPNKPSIPAKPSPPIIAVNTTLKIYRDDNGHTPTNEAPLHAHPVDAFVDSESLLHPQIEPIEVPIDSPIEFFVDDEALSRSPSPIRYARPDSRGHLSDPEEDDIYATASDSSSSRSASPSGAARRKRTQLRAFRNSYRPREVGSSPPLIPHRHTSQVPLLEVQEFEVGKEGDKEKKKEKKKKEKKETRRTARSYFELGTGPASAAGSAPGTRASSPERKSRSRQPRRLAEAVTMALEEVRNRGRAGSGAGVPSVPPLPSTTNSSSGDLGVLDISVQSLTKPLPTADSTSSGSTRSSSGVAWAQAVAIGRARRAAELAETSSTGSASGSASGSHGLDPDDTPFMWLSTSKPPVHSAPFIPQPPPQLSQHRRVNSYGRQDISMPDNVTEEDSEKGGLACGLPLPKPAITTTITSTVSVSRPPSGASSTFSFGMGRNSTKNKKKRSRTGSMPQPASVSLDPASAYSPDVALSIHVQRNGSESSWVNVDSRTEESGGDGGSEAQEGEVVVVTTKRVMRTIDHGGDIFDHEQETGLADVIPHLRNLKASKS